MQKHTLHVIYVPGLGDRNPYWQRLAVRLWRFKGVESELFQMNWGDKEPWQPKLDRLLKHIDSQTSQGKRVGLVGASAGASAVINAYAARTSQISAVVCLSGKVNYPDTIGPKYRRNNIAFVESAYACPPNLASMGPVARRRIMSVYALYDGLIPAAGSRVKDGKNVRIFSVGHPTTIAFCITIFAPYFLRYIKSKSAPS